MKLIYDLKGLALKSRILLICMAFAALAVSGRAAATGAPDQAGGDEVLDRYLNNMQSQQAGLRGLQMDIDIDAELPKLQKTGKLHALRSISRVGQITYRGLKFIGDNTIKNDLIARYLTAEKQTQDVSQLAISPQNYKFSYKGLKPRDGKDVYVFELKPRKKMVGLFKGELWVDPQTYLPVREAGKFVKNPSIFLKKMEFVRDYEIRNGIALPHHIESRIDTRFWGPAVFSINYSNYGPNEEEQLSSMSPRDTQ